MSSITKLNPNPTRIVAGKRIFLLSCFILNRKAAQKKPNGMNPTIFIEISCRED
jgi:hypothetical protein